MKLLLHTCCAPCSVYCIKSLREEGIEPTVYWFNPNIHPYMEYKARRDCLKEYTKYISSNKFTWENITENSSNKFDYDLLDDKTLSSIYLNYFKNDCFNNPEKLYNHCLKMRKRMIFQEEWKEYWNILFLKKVSENEQLCGIAVNGCGNLCRSC